MKFKRIIDLSQPFVAGGFQNPAFEDGRVEKCMWYDVEGWNAEKVVFATHTGSHVDAAFHKFRGGKSIDKYPLERFVGDVIVMDLRHKQPDEEITLDDVRKEESLICEGMNVFFATGWCKKKKEQTKNIYLYHSPWLGKDAAEYLVEKKVNAVGIDHFSIGGANSDRVNISHEILLSADVLIFEGLKLPSVLFEKKVWFMIGFPLIVKDGSGAPVRMVAMEIE
jgi:arylformamidase